jgi:hypothetical protein
MTWTIESDQSNDWNEQGNDYYANPNYYVYGYVDEQTVTWVNQSDQETTWL